MKNGPTVAEVQQAIDLSWDHKNSYNENRNVLPYASSFVAKASLSNTKPLVKHTYVVGYTDGDLAAYAIVQLNGGMSTYDVAGWHVTLLTQDAGLAKTLDGTHVGDKTWEDEAIVSVDGGPLVTYQEALEILELRQLQKKARQQQAIETERVTIKIRQREIRLQQDKQNLAKFQQLRCFEDALRNELQLQEALLLKLQHECESLDQVRRLEQDTLDANKIEEASLAPMRKEAVLLCKQEQEQKIAKLNAKKKIQHEQNLQQDRLLQQQKAAKILEAADKVAQKQQAAQMGTEVKSRQQAIDKCADRYERSLDAIEYKSAKFQLESIKHYIKEGANAYTIHDRVVVLRSRCVASQKAELSRIAEASSAGGELAKSGAIVGGLFGIIGGPVGIAVGAIVGGLLGNTLDHDSRSATTPEQQQWATLLSNIDELMTQLPEPKES